MDLFSEKKGRQWYLLCLGKLFSNRTSVPSIKLARGTNRVFKSSHLGFPSTEHLFSCVLLFTFSFVSSLRYRHIYKNTCKVQVSMPALLLLAAPIDIDSARILHSIQLQDVLGKRLVTYCSKISSPAIHSTNGPHSHAHPRLLGLSGRLCPVSQAR